MHFIEEVSTLLEKTYAFGDASASEVMCSSKKAPRALLKHMYHYTTQGEHCLFRSHQDSHRSCPSRTGNDEDLLKIGSRGHRGCQNLDAARQSRTEQLDRKQVLRRGADMCK